MCFVKNEKFLKVVFLFKDKLSCKYGQTFNSISGNKRDTQIIWSSIVWIDEIHFNLSRAGIFTVFGLIIGQSIIQESMDRGSLGYSSGDPGP